MRRMHMGMIAAMLGLALVGSAWAQEEPSVGLSIGRTALEFAAGAAGTILPIVAVPLLGEVRTAQYLLIAASPAVGAVAGGVAGYVAATNSGENSELLIPGVITLTALGAGLLAPTGAVVGYKLSRRPAYGESGRFFLDPPTLAFTLKPSRDGRGPQVPGLRAGLNLRF